MSNFHTELHTCRVFFGYLLYNFFAKLLPFFWKYENYRCENFNFQPNFDFWRRVYTCTRKLKLKFWPKIEILAKNRNFGKKWKCWSKIEILVKNRNFGQKSEFWSKIEILVKNRNFGQKSKFWWKIKILVKNRNFGEKSIFQTKSKFLTKPKFLAKIGSVKYAKCLNRVSRVYKNIFCS